MQGKIEPPAVWRGPWASPACFRGDPRSTLLGLLPIQFTTDDKKAFHRAGHGSLFSGELHAHSQPHSQHCCGRALPGRAQLKFQVSQKKKILKALIVSTRDLIQMIQKKKKNQPKKHNKQFCLNRRGSVGGAGQVDLHQQAKQAAGNSALVRAVRKIQVLEIPGPVLPWVASGQAHPLG